MASELKIYPSGFLGSAIVKQTEPMNTVEVARRIFSGSHIAQSSKHTASDEVQRLWAITLSNTKASRSFEHNEEILRIALVVFGTHSLVEWITAQQEDDEFGDTHSRWIDETLDFVFTGKPRKLFFHSWASLLTADGNVKPREKVSPTVKRLLYSGPYLTNKSGMTIKEFITAWVRQSDGIEDLIASLYVLFGTR